MSLPNELTGRQDNGSSVSASNVLSAADVSSIICSAIVDCNSQHTVSNGISIPMTTERRNFSHVNPISCINQHTLEYNSWDFFSNSVIVRCTLLCVKSSYLVLHK